jgi:hypothetical protein
MVRSRTDPPLSENPQSSPPTPSRPRPEPPGPADTPCENPRLRQNAITMDIERVNAIGSLLADLSARTEQLRGYL